MTTRSTNALPRGGLRVVRPGGVLALGAALGVVGWWLGRLAWADVSQWGAQPPAVDAVVGAGAAGIAALACGWLALGVVVTVAQALGGHLHRPALLPTALRTAVIWAVGAGLTVGVIGPASASGGPAPVGEPRPATVATFSPVDLGWAPSQPGADPQDAAGTPGATSSPGDEAPPLTSQAPEQGAHTARESARDVRVARGDTLWDIASRHLGEQASDAQISREWQRWYAANRDTVGPDPDVILPGQLLSPPE